MTADILYGRLGAVKGRFMRRTDVVVAGGGPVGLCLALLLAERGIDVVVVEAEAEPSRDLRASTFHPPTLDMLEELGITAVLLQGGLPCPHWQVRLHPSGERAVFDLSVLAADTRHPFRLQCEQWKLSDALRAALAGRVEIMAGARVTGFDAEADGVTVSVAGGDGPVEIRCAFLAGCDGARSTVRTGMGLGFEGTLYPETTILATTRFAFEEHLEGLSPVSYCWQEDAGNFSLLRVPGRWRVSIYPREDVPIEAQLTPAALDASLQAIVRRDEPYEVGESRPYRVSMRIVETYARGRVALAGDAAHVNSPAGGMGLNGGLHDAFALADALAGKAPEAALQRYDAIRRPIAQDEIMAQADRNRARMRERDPGRRRALLAELQAVAADPVRSRAHLLRTSMIDGLRRAKAVA